MAGIKGATNKRIMEFYRMEGVRDIQPMKARAAFAKALLLEEQAGQTTEEAETLLDQAIEALI